MAAFVVRDAYFPKKKEFVQAVLKEARGLVGLYLNVQSEKTHVILGDQWVKLWGHDHLRETMNGLTLDYSPGSFFQINTEVAEELFRQTVTLLNPTSDDFVLDLYCGVGAMTLMAAKKAGGALGIEWAASSVRDAKHNAVINHVHNVRFLQGDACRLFQSEVLERLDRRFANNLLVLVDPPRSGCEESLLKAILQKKPKRLVYVSCDPATLARDIKRLSPFYRVQSVTPFDMFPQTSHIESVTCLDRQHSHG
jgi:23S rRNA (uracil1939-C5)-methyltransferase